MTPRRLLQLFRLTGLPFFLLCRGRQEALQLGKVVGALGHSSRGLMVSSNCGSLCKALLSGRTCAGFRVVFAVGTGPLHDASSRG